MTASASPAPQPGRNYYPWLLSTLLLAIAYSLLGLTFTESLSHANIMQRCVLVDPKLGRIWSVGNIEIGLAYLGVFLGMTGYFVAIFRRNRAHLIDLGIACLYLLVSFLIDLVCVQHFQPFVALLVGDAVIMTFTVVVSRQLWFQRLLGVFVPIIFLTCGVGHFLEGLSYWQLTYPFNVPWTMVTADIGFAVLVNSARFPAFIRGQDVVEELEAAQQQREKLEHQLALSLQSQREIELLNVRLERAMTETHHRLKNNLQLIAAMADIAVEDDSTTVPVSAVNRIGQHSRLLAAIHDILTHSSKSSREVEQLSTAETLNRLIPLLQATTDGRTLKATFDDFLLPVQASTSLALLISEMVSNSLKHGAGDILLTLRVQEQTAELEVCDSGSGFAPGFNPQKDGNTGLDLIDSTGRYDLRGSVYYENRPEGGARVRVVFPILA